MAEITSGMPSFEYLFGCSDQSLDDLQLAFLNRGSQALKTAKIEWNQAVTEFVNADVVRVFREHRGELLAHAVAHAQRTIDVEHTPQFPERRRG